MAGSTSLTSSVSAFVKITPSGITANLVQYGTSMITRGHEQDLTLDPGRYSVDLDGSAFNAKVSVVTPSSVPAHISSIRRTGSMNTTAASTVCPTFRTRRASCCPSMTLGQIPSIHHASPTNQARHHRGNMIARVLLPSRR